MNDLTGSLSRMECNQLYANVLKKKDHALLRALMKADLFCLLTVGCNRQDANREWIFQRCREVERNPDFNLDLWAREHYKSTIITFALTIQDILNDPDVTFGIFSHTRPIAKAFLRQIMQEFEKNDFLKKLFPDVLYAEPRREARKWSEDGGIVVKRKGNPKEATVEAHGLVDGQPTSKHFCKLLYDDIVTLESVSTPEQMRKTTEAWEVSLNLGSDGGAVRLAGTRYHFLDTYSVMIKRGIYTVRCYPATDDGTMGGKAVLVSDENLGMKLKAMGSYTFACQMLLNPKEDAAMNFKREWLRQYFNMPDRKSMNVYLIVDPANEKKKTSDYTVMLVIGLHADGNYYLLDGLRARLNLTERTSRLFMLHRKWRPDRTGYEHYGIQADIQHIEERMEQINYRFKIIPLGGAMPKNDRIRRLIPVCENGRFWLPAIMAFNDENGETQDFIQQFLDDEYDAFPVAPHDDMLDCAARITDEDLKAVFPIEGGSRGGASAGPVRTSRGRF